MAVVVVVCELANDILLNVGGMLMVIDGLRFDW